jgi:hypothetical protein
MLQEGLYARLTADTGVKAVLGTATTRSDNTTGVFRVQMPERTPLPAIVTTQIAGADVNSLDGRGTLRTQRIEVACYGKSYANSRDAAHAAQVCLLGFVGTLPDGTEVQDVLFVMEAEAFEEVPFIYRATFDVEVWYRDTDF